MDLFERLITCNFAYEVNICNLFIDRSTRTTYEVQRASEKHEAWEVKTWNLYKFSPFPNSIPLTFTIHRRKRVNLSYFTSMGRHNFDLGDTTLMLGRRNLGPQGNGATQPTFRAKCNLGEVKLKTMLASSLSYDQRVARKPLQDGCRFIALQQRSSILLEWPFLCSPPLSVFAPSPSLL